MFPTLGKQNKKSDICSELFEEICCKTQK